MSQYYITPPPSVASIDVLLSSSVSYDTTEQWGTPFGEAAEDCLPLKFKLLNQVPVDSYPPFESPYPLFEFPMPQTDRVSIHDDERPEVDSMLSSDRQQLDQTPEETTEPVPSPSTPTGIRNTATGHNSFTKFYKQIRMYIRLIKRS